MGAALPNRDLTSTLRNFSEDLKLTWNLHPSPFQITLFVEAKSVNGKP